MNSTRSSGFSQRMSERSSFGPTMTVQWGNDEVMESDPEFMEFDKRRSQAPEPTILDFNDTTALFARLDSINDKNYYNRNDYTRQDSVVKSTSGFVYSFDGMPSNNESNENYNLAKKIV